ncbi:MAG: DUF1501 domain-containing protein [Verrucomicrobia bacterium]|nr:MAG: DUF1501 domain-containing protein [Verrucomicrobiota bacterium]
MEEPAKRSANDQPAAALLTDLKQRGPLDDPLVIGGGEFSATDEFGCHTTEPPVHDLHATILHQMGIHHERLTCRTRGRDFRLNIGPRRFF